MTGLLVRYAGIALAFTGVSPRGILALVIGLIRSALRVPFHAPLLTDALPPLRRDQSRAGPPTARPSPLRPLHSPAAPLWTPRETLTYAARESAF